MEKSCKTVASLIKLGATIWTKTAYVSIFMIVALLLSACQKGDCEPPEKINRIDSRIENTPAEYTMTFDGKLLIFKSVEGYQRAIELDFVSENEDETAIKKHIFQEMLKKYGFQNYFSSHSNDEEAPMDDWLGQFLNPDGAIQIADHVYKIDLKKEKVYVLDVQYKESDYNALINGATSERVAEYSIDDDVIDAVQDPDYQAKRGCGGIGEGRYWSYSTEDFTHPSHSENIVRTMSDGVVYRLNPYVKFFKAGVYHRLTSGYEVWRFPSISHTSGGQLIPNHTFVQDPILTGIQIHIKGPQAWWKRRPCNNNTTGTRSEGHHYTKNASSHRETIYVGIRNLNGYYLFVRGRAQYQNGTTSSFTTYGGRNINSPY